MAVDYFREIRVWNVGLALIAELSWVKQRLSEIPRRIVPVDCRTFVVACHFRCDITSARRGYGQEVKRYWILNQFILDIHDILITALILLLLILNSSVRLISLRLICRGFWLLKAWRITNMIWIYDTVITILKRRCLAYLLRTHRLFVVLYYCLSLSLRWIRSFLKLFTWWSLWLIRIRRRVSSIGDQSSWAHITLLLLCCYWVCYSRNWKSLSVYILFILDLVKINSRV